MKIAFDLGGTTYDFAINDKNKIIARDKGSMEGIDKDGILDIIAHIVNTKPIKEIGISAPGAIDKASGYCKGKTGIKNFANFNLYDELRSRLNDKTIRIVSLNDAKSALLGILSKPENRHVKSAIMVSFGTGIGGAFYLNSEIWNGQDNFAGEIGFPIWKDGKSISEVLSTVNFLKREFGHNDGVKVMDEYDSDLLTKEKVDGWINDIALFLNQLTFYFNPQLIFITGGITKNKKWFELLDNQFKKIQEFDKTTFVTTKIAPITDNENYGLLGAMELLK